MTINFAWPIYGEVKNEYTTVVSKSQELCLPIKMYIILNKDSLGIFKIGLPPKRNYKLNYQHEHNWLDLSHLWTHVLW